MEKVAIGGDIDPPRSAVGLKTERPKRTVLAGPSAWTGRTAGMEGSSEDKGNQRPDGKEQVPRTMEWAGRREKGEPKKWEESWRAEPHEKTAAGKEGGGRFKGPPNLRWPKIQNCSVCKKGRPPPY